MKRSQCMRMMKHVLDYFDLLLTHKYLLDYINILKL